MSKQDPPATHPLEAAWEQFGDRLRKFVGLEAAGGLVLMVAAALGMLVANSPFRSGYEALLNLEGEIRVGALAVEKPLFLWVNDLWMAVFFFLVSMEIKREVLDGHLSDRKGLILPAAAAAGGILVPAAVFLAINWGDSAALAGWAIPTATDIAFALGVLALLGSAVPAGLKVLLMTIAVIDDLAAIVIIAVFYSGSLSTLSLSIAAVGLATLIVLNRLGVTNVVAYVLIGIALWVCVLKSGVHATLAGVALGFAIPGRSSNADEAPLNRLIEVLHPWVAFAVLPAFAFVNSGVDLGVIDAGTLLGGIPLGVAVGLFVGKPLGVFSFAWLTVALGFAPLPQGTRWAQILGVATLCGVGFTMSLFIGSLAFEAAGAGYAGIDRLGIIVGSLAAGITGYLVLRSSIDRPAEGDATLNGR